MNLNYFFYNLASSTDNSIMRAFLVRSSLCACSSFMEGWEAGIPQWKAASISLVTRPLVLYGYKQYPESFKRRNKGVRPVAEQWRHSWLPRGGCVARATVRNTVV